MKSSKTCAKCGETKPATEFCKDNRQGDGLASYCRECNRERAKQWRKENPDKIAEYLDRKRRILMQQNGF